MDITRISAEPYDERMLYVESAPERLVYFLDSLFDLLRIGGLSRYLLFTLSVRQSWLRALEELDDDRLRSLQSALHDIGAQIGPRGLTLQDAGLTGSELDMKLHGYAEARSSFHVRGGITNLKRALRWGKAILSSLTKVIPFAEFLLELIEALENGAEDIRDLEAGRL